MNCCCNNEECRINGCIALRQRNNAQKVYTDPIQRSDLIEAINKLNKIAVAIEKLDPMRGDL